MVCSPIPKLLTKINKSQRVILTEDMFIWLPEQQELFGLDATQYMCLFRAQVLLGALTTVGTINNNMNQAPDKAKTRCDWLSWKSAVRPSRWFDAWRCLFLSGHMWLTHNYGLSCWTSCFVKESQSGLLDTELFFAARWYPQSVGEINGKWQLKTGFSNFGERYKDPVVTRR